MATDVFGRGIDVERINLAINYDLPGDAASYLHRVGRAGRFGTKGLSISFVSSEDDQKVLDDIAKRFAVPLKYVPPADPNPVRFVTDKKLTTVTANSPKVVSMRAPT